MEHAEQSNSQAHDNFCVDCQKTLRLAFWCPGCDEVAVAQTRRLHLVRPGGRAFCGRHIDALDLFVTAAGGWRTWARRPVDRCTQCEQSYRAHRVDRLKAGAHES